MSTACAVRALSFCLPRPLSHAGCLRLQQRHVRAGQARAVQLLGLRRAAERAAPLQPLPP